MKVRGTIAGTPLSAKLTALCWGVLALFAPVAVSACTSSSSPSTPVFSPSVTISPTGSVTAPASSGSTATSTTSSTPGVSSGSPAPETHTVTATVTAAAAPTSSTSPVPSAAPVTGGGGTAGFQDTLLLGLGAAAILAGAGSIAYRRRLSRDR